jgi:hypothetical protein
MKNKCTLKQLFSKRGTWAKNYYAYDKKGSTTEPNESGAVKFCLMGGARHCYGEGPACDRVAKRLRKAINKLFPNRYGGIVDFNDAKRTRRKDILAVVEEANV